MEECKAASTKSRRIGLGVTGLHYMLIKLGLRYGSENCIEFLERLFMTIRNEAYKTSVYLARDKGAFMEFDYKKYLSEGFAKSLPPSIRHMIKTHGIRNALLLTVAPVGTMSMVAGVSTGIEPIFAPMYKRTWKVGDAYKKQVVVDPLFKEFAEAGKDLSVFCGAYDVTPLEHIKVQAAIQKYVDNAVSKTCNVPRDYETKELSQHALAFARDLKGFTVYRQGSKDNEPLEAIELTEENIKKYLKNAKIGVADGMACSLTGVGCEG